MVSIYGWRLHWYLCARILSCLHILVCYEFTSVFQDSTSVCEGKLFLRMINPFLGLCILRL